MNPIILLLIAGFLLICAEVFVPGGILGSIGALLWIAAVVQGYRSPDLTTTQATSLLLGVTVVSAVLFYLWVRYFPQTPIGRKMTLSATARDFSAADRQLQEMLGREGVARSALRPAGVAEIDGNRVDVVSEGGRIPPGSRIRVIEVEGNRVVVRRIDDGSSA